MQTQRKAYSKEEDQLILNRLENSLNIKQELPILSRELNRGVSALNSRYYLLKKKRNRQRWYNRKKTAQQAAQLSAETAGLLTVTENNKPLEFQIGNTRVVVSKETITLTIRK